MSGYFVGVFSHRAKTINNS